MATFLVFFGCIAFFVVIGIVLAIFSSIFGWRRRRWGYPGYYYDRPRPFFPWLFMGEWFPRRGFYGPRGEFGRREHFEHMHHGPDRAGGAFGGGHSHGPDRAGGAFGGGHNPGGHGGFGGGGHMGGGGHGG